MEITRSTFLKGLFSAFGAGGGRIFAVPPGWTPPKGPRLTIAARPITSLGTAGHAIACVYDRTAVRHA